MENPIYIPLLEKDDEELEKEIENSIQNKLRKGFIWKVFGILLYQLILTSLFIFITSLSSTITNFILTDSICYISSIIISLICLLLPLCSVSIYRKFPINYIILTIFTLCIAYLTSIIVLMSNSSNVTVAFVLTFVTVITLTIYAWKSENDFTIYGGVLCTFLVLLIFGSVIMVFFTVPLVMLLIDICVLLCLAFYLTYDVQLLVGNKRFKFEEEDYILAAINLYLDIVNIFIEILRLFNFSSSQ